jgi:hypothetical protein
MEQKTTDQVEDFFPKGAIAFFAAMLLFFGAVWAALYALMLHRR